MKQLFRFSLTVRKGPGSSQRHREGGVVLVFLAITLVVILAAAAYTVDFGRALKVKRDLQIASDAAAISAANLLPASDATVLQEVRAILTANGVNGTTEAQSIECGVWDTTAKTFTSCSGPCTGACPCTSCSDGVANSVQIRSKRDVGTTLARLVGVNTLQPDVLAVAIRDGSTGGCIRPFGILRSILDSVAVGQEFTVGGKQAPGNWGKLDIGGNMSSGNNFESAMLNGVCNAQIAVGGTVSTGTGFGGSISHVLDDFSLPTYQSNALNMLIALVDGFTNNTSTMLEFARVDFVRQSGSGSNWQGTFRLVARDQVPPTPPGAGPRELVK